MEFSGAILVVVIVGAGRADAECEAIEGDQQAEADCDHEEGAGPADGLGDFRDQPKYCDA